MAAIDSKAGFVGHGKDGHFVHYCGCGRWGIFGYNYFPRQGKLGIWYCREHWPKAIGVK
jgi:hypothetical protein